MRYPVVNLHRRMGGMLEDYQNAINDLKNKLNYGGYSQPGPTPAYTPPPPPPPPPRPPSGPTGIVPNAPMTVSTGIPPNPANPPWPFIDYGYPPIPPPQECPPGYTWTPSGCKPNVPSVNRELPPETVPVSTTAPPQPSIPTTTGMAPTEPTGPSVESPGVPSVDCGPGKFWDGAQCQDNAPTVATRSGGGLLNTAFGGGSAAATSTPAGTSLLGRTVPIQSISRLGGPAFARPIRLAGGRA